ncbi:MAG TPA: sulfotransferase domain-containing protein [Solirubrobacterales bacterium]
MLRNRLERAARMLETDFDAVVARAGSLALARAPHRPPPIYVTGLGGSGSHWLTGTMASMLPVVDLEEAPIPDDFRAQVEALPVEERGVAIDCLHLGHALATADSDLDSLVEMRAINSAVRVSEPCLRSWDPRCFVIHLLRDPRDQATCFAFRKRVFRQRHYPTATDEQYLAGCAVNNATNYAQMRKSALQPDFVCRYEEMKTSTATVLTRLATALGQPADAETAVRVAREHDASLMRSGALPHRGNLTAAESRGWRAETDAHQKLILHAHLAEVVTAAEYPADDCLGYPLDLGPSPGARHLYFGQGGRLGGLFVRNRGRDGATWSRLGEARGPVSVDSGVELKLRVDESAAVESIRSLCTLPPDALDSLCLAGNRNLDDDLLAACTAALRDLREVDLARTAVGDGCVDSLALLPRLVGVSVFGTALSSRALSALQERVFATVGKDTVVVSG